MPRKRKGPPQESIDSILLALSRRDDLGPETLAHYLDRLDEEWTNGARQRVLQLLRSNDTSAHTAAMFILSELATSFDLDEIEEFITDPTVSDGVKLALAPLLKELGSSFADETMLEYLNDPASAMQQMQMRILEVVNQGEMGIQALLNDFTSMPLERRLSFIEWLGSSNDPRAVRVLIPLLEGQTGKMVSAVIDALELLGPVASSQAIPALDEFIASTSNRELKQRARATLGRLTMQIVPDTENSVLAPSSQQLPVYEAYASFLDGTGAQLLMLSWQRPDGMIKVFHLFFQDQWGIKDCYGVDQLTGEQWRDMIQSIQEKSFGCFRVPFSYIHALVAEARTIHKKTRRKIPIGYFIWRPLLQGDIASQREAIPVVLPPRPLNDEICTLALHGDTLYNLAEFTSWMYEPLARVEPYINTFWTSSLSAAFMSQEGRSTKRTKSSKQRTKVPPEEASARLDTIVMEALNELVDKPWRLLYEVRLRRQAALFQLVERQHDADLCMATAAVLHPDSEMPVQEQPFLKTMMRLSIEQGPLRMMAQRLEEMGADAPMTFPPM